MRTPCSLRAAAVAVLVLAAGCAHDPYQPKGKPVPYDGFFATFPSGLRAVVYQVPGARRTSLTVSYGAGGVDEEAGKGGVARLAAHLSYRAAPSRGVRLWDRSVAAGLRFDVGVGRDATDFQATGSAGELEAALAIEVDRMRAPLAGVTEDDLALERDLVAGVLRDRQDADPDGVQLDWVAERLYGDASSYGRRAFSSGEELGAVKLADVAAFTAAHYRPENAVVVVAGPLGVREAATLIVRAFGDLADPSDASARHDPRKSSPPAPQPILAQALENREAPVAHPVLWVAWPAPGAQAKREPLGHAAAAGLVAAFRAKLQSEYGAEARLQVASASARLESWAGAGVLALRLELLPGADPKKLADLARSAAFDLRGVSQGTGGVQKRGTSRDRIEQSLDNFSSSGLGAGGAKSNDPMMTAEQAGMVSNLKTREDQLAAMDARRTPTGGPGDAEAVTRDRLLVESYLALERLRGAEVARFLRATGQADYLAGWQKLVAAQLRGGLAGYATEYLARERSVAILVSPGLDLRARGVAPASAAPSFDLLPDDGAAAAPGPEAIQALATMPGLDNAERRVLENGLTVVVAHRGVLPVAEVRLVVRTTPEGADGAPPGLPALALATADAAFEPAEPSLVGGAVQVQADRDQVVLTARGATANLDALLGRTSARAQSHRVQSFKELRQALVSDVTARGADPTDLALRTLRDALYPSHPYAAAPTPAGAKALEKAAAEGWLDAQLAPERATLLVVSGEPPSPELWKAVEHHFATWKRGGGPRAAIPVAALPQARKVVLVDQPGADRALVTVALRAPERSERDEVALEAIRLVVRDRLVRAVELEAGAGHGTAVELLDEPGGAALVGAVTVDTAEAAAALSTLLATPRALADKPLVPAELARVRWQLAREQAHAYDTVGGSADGLALLARYELPPAHLEQGPAQVASLDPARVQATAASLSVGREVVVVVGDAATLKPALEKAGLEVAAR